jgi:tetratricopeptide (TPR) repeat protein/KaiC/GvpD/RAD55 family RecA-like ATPase
LQSKVLAEPAFVGREQELAQLQHHLELALEGKGTAVFVSGEAGSGKTRLTTEFLNRAKKHGVTALTSWCLSNAAVPYFPFFEAFNAYFSGEHEPKRIGPEELEVTAWLMGPSQAEKVGKSQAISPQVWKDQTFAAVARTLTTISTRKPAVLFIDDVHWADSASLALIHYIARAIGSERVLLLATFRSEQLTPDAEGRPHPLVETLRLMRREDLVKEIKIANLNQTSVSDLAKSMLGGDLQPELAEKLAGESQGNPLFIVESLRMLHERGGLIREGDQWRLSTGALGIPPKIKDIILQRLSVLLRGQRRVLDAASVIGEKFNVEVLGSVLGLNRLEIIETLDTIAKDTSLVYCEGELYMFDNARSRDAIYDEVSIALKREYHAKVAEKLESTFQNGRLPFSELAYHYAQAGNKEKAVKYALAAGQDALARWSNSQAIEHFAYALQNVPEGHAEEKRTALEGLGDAYAANYMYAEAIKTFDELAASEMGAVRLRALRKVMDAAYLKGDKPDLLLEYARKAEELAVYDRLEMARVLNNRGRAFHWAGRGDLKMDLADYDAALQIFEEENSLADVAEALCRSGEVCVSFEDLQEKGLGELLRSVAIFRELGDVRKEIVATYGTGYGLAFSGLFPEARREFAKVLRVGEKLGVFAELARASGILSLLDEGDGKLSEALSQVLKAVEYAKKTDAYYMQGVELAALTRLYSKLGDLKRADEYFDRIKKLPPEVLSTAAVGLTAPVSKGVYFAAKGQWEESNQSFEKSLDDLKITKAINLETVVREEYAWSLESQDRVEEARVQRERAQRVLEQVEERFGHANVQLSLMVPRKVQLGEEFEMRLDLVNVGRKPALLVEIKNMLLDDLEVSSSPPWCRIQDGAVKMKNKELGPFQVNTAKLTLKSLKAGTFTLNPQAVYIDDLGETKTCNLRTVTITANPPAPKERVAGKIPSGTPDLDRLFLGGIPENYAIILAAPSSDERGLLIRRFLEAGADAGETTFYVTVEPGNARRLATEYPSNFFLLVCNPQADAMIQNLPSVFKLKGVENLTEIDIALTKAFRTLKPSAAGPKRICIEILSDVLLQHHAVTTRKWLSGLLPNLKSKRFTTLAVLNPRMHPEEEVQAILGLFEGEIWISERETVKGTEKVLRIRRLYHQKYLEGELSLTAGKVE